MILRWELKQTRSQGKLVQQNVLQSPDPNCFKDLEVRPQDIFTLCTQKSVLPDLEPRLQVRESQALVELPEEIHQPKIHQEVDDLLALGVLGLPYVGIKLSHHEGVLFPEAYQGLLQF